MDAHPPAYADARLRIDRQFDAPVPIGARLRRSF